jgi:hypothetical protein
MGGGKTKRSELAKSRVDLLALIPKSDEFLGMAARAAEFCHAPPEIPFDVIDGAEIEIGMAARVVSAADPMPVMNGVGQIGIVDDAFAVALRGCLSMGYEFTGKVSALNDDATGAVVIRGRRRGSDT